MPAIQEAGDTEIDWGIHEVEGRAGQGRVSTDLQWAALLNGKDEPRVMECQQQPVGEEFIPEKGLWVSLWNYKAWGLCHVDSSSSHTE